jgi:hypothetical protein
MLLANSPSDGKQISSRWGRTGTVLVRAFLFEPTNGFAKPVRHSPFQFFVCAFESPRQEK